MNNNNNFKTDQYLLRYEQQQSTAQFINVGEATMSNTTIIESEPSQILLCSNAPKHDKRRSYNISKRCRPTTHLNANPSNFRDIVQKFTGRSSGIDIPVGRKGPVTLDFRSPASVSKEVIFPSSGDIQNHDCAIDTHVGDGESHVNCEWEGKQTLTGWCEMGQLSDDHERYGGCDDYAHENYDYHNDDHDLMREYLEINSFNGVITMGFDEFYHDAVMVEEFLMRDLDI